VEGRFDSAARRAPTGWAIAYPPGTAEGDRLNLLLVLHGRADDHRAVLGSHQLGMFLAQAVRSGIPPFAVVAVDGGDHDYWHPRVFGDPQRMLIDEFLPLLHKLGLRADRIALLGWSMGGYGALHLAMVLGRSRVAAAVAESPAIWQHSWQSVAGAFDSAEDFDRNAIFGNLARLGGIPLRVDCGASDGFAPVTRALRAALSPTPAGGIEPGNHDGVFWRSQAAAQFAFLGRHLAV
jgi:S-formylglutathione hydrolase FrmB